MQQPTMSHPGGGAPGPGTCRQVLGHRVSGHLPAAATDDEPPVRVPSAATHDQGQLTPWTPGKQGEAGRLHGQHGLRVRVPACLSACSGSYWGPHCLHMYFAGCS
jgi:hypothetical protein